MRKNWPLVAQALADVGQGSRNSLAAAIATVAIETASTFDPVLESFWLTDAQRRVAHARYYPYIGRGFIQLTWRENYATYGRLIGMGDELVSNPDLAMQPDVAARLFAAYWKGRDIQEPADRGDWREVRKRVQGADAGLDRLVQIVGRLL